MSWYKPSDRAAKWGLIIGLAITCLQLFHTGLDAIKQREEVQREKRMDTFKVEMLKTRANYYRAKRIEFTSIGNR